MEIRRSDIDRMSKIYYRAVRLLKEAGNSWTIAECLCIINRIYEDMFSRGYITLDSFLVFEEQSHSISISSLNASESEFCRYVQERCSKTVKNQGKT